MYNGGLIYKDDDGKAVKGFKVVVFCVVMVPGIIFILVPAMLLCVPVALIFAAFSIVAKGVRSIISPPSRED